MKVYATNEFNGKLNMLNDGMLRDELLLFIEKVNLISDVKEIIKISDVDYKDVYTYRITNYRIFYSISSPPEKEQYLLLLDLIKKDIAPNRINQKNPKFNNLLNPNRNNMINPNRNNMINPNRNNMINPNRNNMINPSRNNMINPSRNNMINPSRNNMINPKRNLYFDGLFIYNFDLEPIEFIVNSNNGVIQFFDFSLNNIRFGVRHDNNGYVLFDLNNNWIGHLESDSQSGYNEFDLDNNWKRIIK